MASLQRFASSPGFLVSVVLGLLSLIFYWPLLDYFQLNLEDEGNLLFPALNLMRGQIPYEDFIIVVSPGVYYLLAVWLKIFGATFAWARAFAIFVQAFCLVLLYLIGRRVLTSRQAFVASILMGATSLTHWPIASHHWVGMASFLLTVYACQALLEKPESRSRALLAGGVAAASGLMLQSAGACAVALCLLTAVLAKPQVGLKGSLRMCLPGVLGALVAGLPLLIWIIVQVGYEPLLKHLVLGHLSSNDGRLQYESTPFVFFPTESVLQTWDYFLSQTWSQVWEQKGLFMGLFSWPVSHLLTHGLFYPLTVIFLGAAWFVKDPQQKAQVALLAISGAINSLAALYRPDVAHVSAVRHVWWILVIYFVMVGLKSMPRTARAISACSLAFLSILILAYGLYQRQSFSSGPSYYVSLPNGVLRTKNERLATNLNAYSRFLKAQGKTRPKMFVYPIMPILYFLSNGENVTSYERLAPVLFPQEAFEKCLAELEANPPDFLVLLTMDFKAYHGAYPLLDLSEMVKRDLQFRGEMAKIPTTFVGLWPEFSVEEP